MLGSHSLVETIPQKCLSLEEYREVDKLINSNEFSNLNLFPYAAKKLINLYNKNPLVYLDPRVCCKEIDLSPEEILFNYAYLDFWQSINYKYQYSNYYAQSHTPSNLKVKDRQIKTESHDEFPIDQPVDHAKKCVACGKTCRYLVYTIIPSFTGKIVTSAPTDTNLSDHVWCARCYSSGRIPTALSKSHFAKFQIPFEFVDENPLPWTDEETYTLIDSINTYRDDWESIGKAVGRSSHECILKFAQLPIEDIIHKGGSLDISLEPVVFDKTPNEFLAYLAFISNSISPVISSGGAKSALDILLSESNYVDTAEDDRNGLSNELMFKDETFKRAYDEAKEATKQKTQLLADLEKAEKLLKEIYELELQIVDVQVEKFEMLEHKLREYTSMMGDSLINKPQYPQ